MKLNHVNLPVGDVAATRNFFEKHFGFHCLAEPTDANVVLTDNAGLVLTISNLILNFALIPPFGAMGAAWASFAALLANLAAHRVGYRRALNAGPVL